MGFFSSKKGWEVVEFDGGPCPVCGESGGNCKGESEFAGSIQIAPPVKDDPFATFTVPERIYIEEESGSKTVKRLLYPQGARIRPEEAKRLGLM